ncbi:hypothetical protein [Halorubrum vacuolatum]|uniref:Uncharacterized protein n=1 Tax=Halorubrum vacuolatum TaxID=63740 RepID=A0A238VWN1_HALVU|nr:hypothetical protein [Halorubrum vacuolatum]SNR38710.1 hypothetical protein SAMN06264855_104168 [Halorubrum vacuolatum]
MPPEPSHAARPEERSRYELMRVKHVILSLAPIPRKLRWCGYLALIAALPAPIMLLLPADVRATFHAGDPLTVPLAVVTITGIGILSLLLGTLGLAFIGHRTAVHEGLAEPRIWTYIGLEDAFTFAAFITGALATVASVGILASGLAGTGAVVWLEGVGVQPYFSVPGLSLPPVAATVGGLVVAVTAFGSSRWVAGLDG